MHDRCTAGARQVHGRCTASGVPTAIFSPTMYKSVCKEWCPRVWKSSTTTALPVISEVEAEMRRALKWNTQYGNYHDIRRTFLSDFRSLVGKLGAQKVYEGTPSAEKRAVDLLLAALTPAAFKDRVHNELMYIDPWTSRHSRRSSPATPPSRSLRACEQPPLPFRHRTAGRTQECSTRGGSTTSTRPLTRQVFLLDALLAPSALGVTLSVPVPVCSGRQHNPSLRHPSQLIQPPHTPMCLRPERRQRCRRRDHP